MAGSTLTGFNYIPENSEATPGLWNSVFSVLSQNLAEANSIGNLVSNVSTVGMVTINANSNVTDYIHFHDTSNQRSDYLLGSFTTGTADGLNLYDVSGATLIVSFSKQSVRFFQGLVGPVFDTGGALADTYNAATFIGSGSSLSAIQAAINQASLDNVSRVYLPASMYPYSASSISFIYTVQMVREGGDQSVYDIKAYGATGNSVVNDYASVQQAINAAAKNAGVVHIPQGRFRILSKLSTPSNVEIKGAGQASILFFNWFFSSGATSGGDVYLFNSLAATSGNTAIRLHDFAIEGDNASGLPTGTTVPAAASGILFRRGSDIDVARMRVSNIPGISISHQGISNARFLNNYVLGGGHDGITGGSFGTWPSSSLVIEGNVIGPVGDDGIAINKSVDQTNVGTTQPTGISVVGNTIFGEVANQPGAAGRGILVLGGDHLTITGNSFASTFAKGIYIDQDTFSGNANSQYITVTGNVVNGAGQTGDGSQSPNGIDIRNTDYSVLAANVVSNGTAAGIAIVGCTYLDVVGNSIISNGKSITMFGIDCSGSTNTHILIADNIIRNNAGAGLSINLGQGIYVRNNVIVDNGSTGTGALNFGSGVLIQGTGGQAPTVFLTNNVITDTRAAANKTQTYGIVGVSTSNATYLIANNYVSGNSGAGINIGGTPNSLVQYANSQWETGATGNWVGYWSPSAFTAGTALLPGMSFASETSLGWYRSDASAMGLSYGTLDLTNSVTIRAIANSATLPQYRFWGGSGNHFQTSFGRAANEFHFLIANSAGAFNTNTKAGDSIIQTGSSVTLHLGSGTAEPQLSLVSVGGVGRVWAQIGDYWGSGLSIGGGGTRIPAISSMSSLVGAFVVQGSASSFTGITWAAAKIGDHIITSPFQGGAVSSLSSGLVAHSIVTVNGQIEFRLSNVSTLVQNQSSQSWIFTRISAF